MQTCGNRRTNNLERDRFHSGRFSKNTQQNLAQMARQLGLEWGTVSSRAETPRPTPGLIHLIPTRPIPGVRPVKMAVSDGRLAGWGPKTLKMAGPVEIANAV